MDEFRKPFEYYDEKGIAGVLLILFIMLISVEPLLGILSVAVASNSLPGLKVLATLLIALCVIYIIFSLFCGVMLKKMHSSAIAVTKVFLVYRIIIFIPILIFNVRSQIEALSYTVGSSLYVDSFNSIMTSFAISMSYVIIFSAGWYIYLNKSKKVLEWFPKRKFEA